MDRYLEGASKLTGFVYMHRISDTRVGGTSKRNLRMFQKLCGQDSFKNVIIITTMWDRVTLAEGQQREQELMLSDNLFKALIDGGATMARHDGNQLALDVIRDLSHRSDTIAQIVREPVIEKKNLLDTEAGMELQSEVRNILQKHQEDLQVLEDEIKEAKLQSDKRTEEEAAADRRKALEDIAKLHRELEKLGNTGIGCVVGFVYLLIESNRIDVKVGGHQWSRIIISKSIHRMQPREWHVCSVSPQSSSSSPRSSSCPSSPSPSRISLPWTLPVSTPAAARRRHSLETTR